jgi:hypothetical protein
MRGFSSTRIGESLCINKLCLGRPAKWWIPHVLKNGTLIPKFLTNFNIRFNIYHIQQKQIKL